MSEALAAPPVVLTGPVIPVSTISTPPIFRTHFPEFADATVFPDLNVQMFLDLGSVMLSPVRWGSYIQRGVELFAAHNLSMAFSTAQSGGGATPPGDAAGIISSKSVSKVSVSYDSSTTAIEGGGPWNYTKYGQEFLWLVRLFGTGGVEILSLADARFAAVR